MVFLELILITEVQYLFFINAVGIDENFVATKFVGTVQLHKISLSIFRRDTLSFIKAQNEYIKKPYFLRHYTANQVLFKLR